MQVLSFQLFCCIVYYSAENKMLSPFVEYIFLVCTILMLKYFLLPRHSSLHNEPNHTFSATILPTHSYRLPKYKCKEQMSLVSILFAHFEVIPLVLGVDNIMSTFFGILLFLVIGHWLDELSLIRLYRSTKRMFHNLNLSPS